MTWDALSAVTKLFDSLRVFRKMDPRIGIDPSSLARACAVLACHAPWSKSTVGRVEERLRRAESHKGLGTISLYTPTVSNPEFVRTSGWGPSARVSIRRYDKVYELTEVELFALETGGSCELTPTLTKQVARQTYNKLLAGYGFPRLGKVPPTLSVPPLLFSKPASVKKAPVDRGRVRRNRLRHIQNNLGDVNYGVGQYGRTDADLATAFDKVRFHGRLLKSDLGTSLVEGADRLEQEAEALQAEIKRLVADYRARVSALAQTASGS